MITGLESSHNLGELNLFSAGGISELSQAGLQVFQEAFADISAMIQSQGVAALGLPNLQGAESTLPEGLQNIVNALQNGGGREI